MAETVVDYAGLEDLRADGQDRLAKAIAHAENDIGRMVRADKNKLNKLLFGRINVDDVSDRLLRELSKLAVSGVVYSNGARHSLDDYAGMVIRTLTSTAFNLGTIKAAKDAGAEFVQISDGPECGLYAHGEPPIADGMVVSLEEAQANPIAHPRCVRDFSRWVPDKKQTAQDEAPPDVIPSSFGLQRFLARLRR